MRNFLLFIAALLFFIPLRAQTIEGTVYDANSKEPLLGVVVYLNGTSIATSSDGDGNFRLDVTDRISTSLVFSLLGYESLIIENPFERHEKSFFLHEKSIILSEAVIVADKFSRVEKMKAFKEQFLGDSRAGRSCTILNEEDIVFKYDLVENRLTASFTNPLVIKNEYLAYHVTVDVQMFSIQYDRYTLKKSHIKRVSFMVTSSFVDKNPFNLKIAKRREDKYSQSRRYFWKNLVDNTLEKANIKIYNGTKQTRSSLHFNIVTTPDRSIINIKPDADLNRIRNGSIDTAIYGIISVMYDNMFVSELVFMSDQISVDKFGNIENVDKVSFAGDMGKQRIGDMLPLNYVGAY